MHPSQGGGGGGASDAVKTGDWSVSRLWCHPPRTYNQFTCLPPLPSPHRCGAQGSVGIAFDLMSVNLADVPRLPHVVPALKLLFAEEEAGEGEPAEEELE